MRYQRIIIQRLESGLRGVDRVMADELANRFSAPADTLKGLTDGIVAFYREKMQQVGLTDAHSGFPSTPENNEAIPFWIEDLEARTLQDLRMALACRGASA